MKRTLFVLLAVLTVSQAGCSLVKKAQPKNVIIIIGDGMGFNHAQAGSLFLQGQEDALTMQQFPVKLACSTFSASGHGYDPAKAQADFDYLKEKPTDSAAAATALACGVKTYNGAIGVDTLKQPLVNILEIAEQAGKSTGVVTSVPFSHATPAGFVAHDTSRGNYHIIAKKMLTSATDVIIGCGNPFYDDDGIKLSEPKYEYISAELWQDAISGKAGSDADGDGDDDPWTFIESRDNFKLASSTPPMRLFGVAQAASTLQANRSGAKEQTVPFDPPLTESVPTLAEMASAALSVLQQNKNGFCVMIEAGAIDWTGHSNEAPRLIEEMMGMEDMVQTVVLWVEENSDWEQTLVIITADHETGYLTGPESGNFPTQEGGKEAFYSDLVNRGKGQVPGMEWHTNNHTNQLVPVYAEGAGSKGLLKLAKRNDPARGKYIDNTDIANYVKTLLIK
jgi:alkaline phosphatase